MGRYAHSRVETATYTPIWKVLAIVNALIVLTVIVNHLQAMGVL